MTTDAGITFRETMSGGFALGENEPARGEYVGRQAGTALVLHVSLLIPSVARFVDDPEHAGALDGSVSFGPLGVNLPTADGVFKLFVRTGDPALKLMQYAVTFHSDGQTYYLRGAKEVRRGSPLRGWADTTTLPCRLRLAADESATVVGAGVLRLGPVSLARQLLSFRAVNGATVGAQSRAFAAFFGFFTHELLDSYLWPEWR